MTDQLLEKPLYETDIEELITLTPSAVQAVRDLMAKRELIPYNKSIEYSSIFTTIT